MSRFSLVQYGGRVCENNNIVIVITMCSKLMFLQSFKYTDHYYIANNGALVGGHVLSAVVLKD